MTDEQGSGTASPEAPPRPATERAHDAPNESAPGAPEEPRPPADEAATSGDPATRSDTAPQEKPRDKTFWLWVVGIASILAVELYVYGHNGQIEVCVGIEGVTDFAERNQPRNAANFRSAPQCSRRLNLGMYEGTQELSQAALQEACARATVQNRDAMPDCLRRDKKWTRQVYKEQVPPWDPRLYRKLLWID